MTALILNTLLTFYLYLCFLCLFYDFIFYIIQYPKNYYKSFYFNITFEIGNPRPRQELLSAIKEAEEMEKNPEIGKRYSSVKEMIKDILENEE